MDQWSQQQRILRIVQELVLQRPRPAQHQSTLADMVKEAMSEVDIAFITYMLCSRASMIYVMIKAQREGLCTTAQRDQGILTSLTPVVGDMVFVVLLTEGLEGIFEAE